MSAASSGAAGATGAEGGREGRKGARPGREDPGRDLGSKGLPAHAALGQRYGHLLRAEVMRCTGLRRELAPGAGIWCLNELEAALDPTFGGAGARDC